MTKFKAAWYCAETNLTICSIGTVYSRTIKIMKKMTAVKYNLEKKNWGLF